MEGMAYMDLLRNLRYFETPRKIWKGVLFKVLIYNKFTLV